jgi:ABC-type multidrug transport system fused ATPase/permease subunit
LALLTYTSPQLTVFMLAVLPVVVVLAVVFGSRIRKYSKKVQDASAESNAVVEEALQGIATVKAFSGESFEWRRYETRTNTVAQLAIKSGILRGAFASFLILGLFGALVAVVWKGTTLIATGELATGQLVSFVIYSGFIGGSIGGMADVYARLQKAVGATEALLDMLDTPTEPLDARPPHAQKNTQPEALPEPLPNTPHLAFTDVSFSYPARPDLPVLQHLTLSVPRGGQIALVGASGAGKSTLIQLILRFHQPQSGSIQWFGHPLETLPLAELRRTMALVPQEVVLFSGTLRENIAYGLTGTTDEALLEVAAQANALEFIKSFPQGLDTLVGERGVQLSGGQRQRIAIARALLRNPSLLLLDEATSALDSESESLVQDALQRLMAGRTSVVVAHRLSTVRHADAIAVFHKGQVVELGTHEELLALPNGRYRKLLDKQLHG